MHGVEAGAATTQEATQAAVLACRHPLHTPIHARQVLHHKSCTIQEVKSSSLTEADSDAETGPFLLTHAVLLNKPQLDAHPTHTTPALPTHTIQRAYPEVHGVGGAGLGVMEAEVAGAPRVHRAPQHQPALHSAKTRELECLSLRVVYTWREDQHACVSLAAVGGNGSDM